MQGLSGGVQVSKLVKAGEPDSKPVSYPLRHGAGFSRRVGYGYFSSGAPERGDFLFSQCRRPLLNL